MWKLKLVVYNFEMRQGFFWCKRPIGSQKLKQQNHARSSDQILIIPIKLNNTKQQSSFYLPASHSEDGQGVVVTGCDQVGGGLGGDTGDNPLILVIRSIRRSVRTEFRRDYHKYLQLCYKLFVRCDLTSYIMVLKSSQFPSFKHVVDLTGIIGTPTYGKFGTSRHTPS